MSPFALGRCALFSSFVLFAACGPGPSPQPAVRSCETVVRFAPQQSTETVSILGEWFGFAPQPMTQETNGTWTFRETLPARDYGYRFAIGKADAIPDPANAFRR